MTERSTAEKLQAALRAAHAPMPMVSRAGAGYYDDFRSPLAMPKVQLVEDARRAGLVDIVQRTIAGEFDSTQAESQAWMDSAEGQRALRNLGGS